MSKDVARNAAFARRKIAHATAGVGQSDLLDRALNPYLGRAIAGYHPIRTEIDPVPAMVRAARHGAVALPVVVGPGQPLAFYRWTPDAALVEGSFGARIPPTADPVTPEILIVPTVAFDRRGGRLGYGGGFYDRTLELLRAAGPTFAIGFAFAAQEAEDLPLEPVDQLLDLIVTESEIITPDVSRAKHLEV